MKKSTQLVIRQGDVLLRRIDSLPAGAQLVDTNGGPVVLAHGEMTGHTHRFQFGDGEMYRGQGGAQFVKVLKENAKLLHEEHTEACFPVGLYERIDQVEHTDEMEPRVVAD